MAKKRIQSLNAASAEEFVSALRGTAPHWNGGQRDRWLFRGQRDARWGLVPSALRQNAPLSYADKSVRGPLPDVREQAALEVRLAYQFLAAADRLGLPVPGDSYFMRSPQAWAEVIEPAINWDEWPPDAVTELLAIARHHGVPTRLIDFSHSAMKASYFAASGGLAWSRASRKRDRPTKTARFAVWAVNLGVLYAIRNGGDATIKVVTVPRAQNGFLHAQDGVFLLDRNAYVAGNPPTRMEQVFLAWEHALKGKGSLSANDYLVMAVTAPVSEAEAVLRILWDEGVDEASLMPTYDNVVRHLERQRDGL
jgi:hypothetical protein